MATFFFNVCSELLKIRPNNPEEKPNQKKIVSLIRINMNSLSFNGPRNSENKLFSY